jgi:hypothetical protein
MFGVKKIPSNVTRCRYGLLFIYNKEYSFDYVTPPVKNYNLVYEVQETFMDKDFSRIDILRVATNTSGYKPPTRGIRTWIPSNYIHWLDLPTQEARDKKLEEILK